MTATLAPLPDPSSFHVSDLSKDSQDQFASPTANQTQTAHFDGDSLLEQVPNRGLHIQRISSQPVDGVDAHDVAITDVLEQLGEAGPISSQHGAADTFIDKLPFERATQRPTLTLDGLIRCGGTVVSDPAQRGLPWWLRRFLLFTSLDHNLSIYVMIHLEGRFGRWLTGYKF